MNWKCKLGFHDWEQIKSLSNSAIENEVRREMRGGKPGCPITVQYNNERYYEDKICLRQGCGKRIDEITPRKEQVYIDILTKKKRIKAGKDLIKNLTHKGD